MLIAISITRSTAKILRFEKKRNEDADKKVR